jgi:hypothetical protein
MVALVDIARIGEKFSHEGSSRLRFLHPFFFFIFGKHSERTCAATGLQIRVSKAISRVIDQFGI